jgi:hypothetical protein
MQIPSKKTKKFEFFYFGANGPAGRVFFCDLRSFPSPVCDTVGDDPEDVPEGVPPRIL